MQLCPELTPPVEPTGKALVQALVRAGYAYNECALRHEALVEAVQER